MTMDAQTFLYWALAIGFLLLVVFLCVALVHLIRILKDFADASDSIKDTAEIVNENVIKIADQVTATADQIGEYIVKPFSVIKYLSERINPIIEMLQKKGIDFGKAMGHDEKTEKAEEEEKPKKKHRFGRKR